MNDAKPRLPSEEELEFWATSPGYSGLRQTAPLTRLIAIGRKYYTLRSKMRTLLHQCHDEHGGEVWPARELEAMLDEDT